MSVAAKIRPALFICDIQERFRQAIYGYPEVIATSKRLLAAASILNWPVYVTTQNRSRLGNTVSELDVSNAVVDADKTKFSMYVTELAIQLPKGTPVAIVGIESHICVLQTTIDLIKAGHRVYLVADGISSSNPSEKPIALERLSKLGAIVTTSESLIFESMGDSSIEQFRQISKLIKEEGANTKKSLETLCRL